MAVEFVADRHSREPFDPAAHTAERVKDACLALGLGVYPGTGTRDGVFGDHVLVAPPFNVKESEIDVIVSRLAGAVVRVLGSRNI